MAAIVGIDVGGTFTDLYLSPGNGEPDRVVKVPSTPDDPSRGLADALDACGVDPQQLGLILHGTTIATNAVIERKGAAVALVTTQGFRDVLELGRRDRPSAYGLTGIHRPLIPRSQRWEISERLDHAGKVVTPLDEAGVRELAQALAATGLEAVIISFLHSYANPDHERRAAEIFRAARNDWQVVTSSEVVREYYEFERTSTAVVQAYLQPLVSRYAERLQGRLVERSITAQTLVMQSNGGLVPLAQLPRSAANIVRSGPAAGVIAAARLAAQAGFDKIITGDMGGTSFDVAVVVDGQPHVAETTELDFRIPLRLPMIDVHTIGAGGGSIASLDRGGMLTVGPQSAGAVPGPVCFARGGTQPTVADANAVLARINPDHPIGLTNIDRLDVDAARKALADLGAGIGLDAEDAALAILTVVNQAMAGRTRLLTVEQGHDPRDFALVIFGGAGPLHGAAIMREVGIRTMILPPYPGVQCALGCAIADIRYDMSLTVERPVSEVAADFAADALAAQRREGEGKLAISANDIARTAVDHVAQMSFAGQIHSLRVPIEQSWTPARMADEFRKVYAREYGEAPGDLPVTLVSLKTTVHGLREQAGAAAEAEAAADAPQPAATRPVRFDRWIDTPIYRRETLRFGHRFPGPAIIEQADTTAVIEPGMAARVDRYGNILVEMAS